MPALNSTGTSLAPRVVLDTNVVVALLVYVDPKLIELQESWKRNQFVALATEETLEEFERVLRYPALRLAETVAQSAVAAYRERCVIVSTDSSTWPRLPRCRDPDDQKFLLLGQRAGATVLLTRDKALLSMKNRVPFTIAPPEWFKRSLYAASAE